MRKNKAKKKPTKKKPELFHHFEVPLDIYNTHGAGSEEWGMNAYGRTLHKEGYSSIVWFPHYPKTPDDYGALAHETFHATSVLLRAAGMLLTVESEEAFTYLQDHLVTEFLKVRDKKK